MGSKVDETTQSAVAIDWEHHEVHDGHHYFATSYIADVDNTATTKWTITVPASSTRVHLVWRGECSLSGLWELIEGVTTSDGSAVTAYNSDRNSVNASIITVKSAATVTGGTTLAQLHVGTPGTNANSRIGGNVRAEEELILKSNTKYAIVFTAEADNTRATLELFWYEI